MERKYLKIGYFQKSKLLFAMIAETLANNFTEHLIKTYLFSETTEENINQYYLLAEFKPGFQIIPSLEKYLTNIYETKEETLLYIFHIISHKDDVDKFMQGKYSEFSQETKDRISLYYNFYTLNEKNGKIQKISKENLLKLRTGTFEMHVIINPTEYIEEVAKEMVPLFYDNLDEAIQNVIEMKEVVSKYDRKKETFTKKIK